MACVQLENHTEIRAKSRPFETPLANTCRPRFHHRPLRWNTSSERTMTRPMTSGIAHSSKNMENVPENEESTRKGVTKPSV